MAIYKIRGVTSKVDNDRTKAYRNGFHRLVPLNHMVQVPGGEEDPFLPARVGVDAVGLQYYSTVRTVYER
jgi:hypothetical protein